MAPPDAAETWPAPPVEGLVVEHVTFSSGGMQGPDGWQPTVTLDLLAREVRGGAKRTVRLHLDADLADQFANVLPRAAGDARQAMREAESRGER